MGYCLNASNVTVNHPNNPNPITLSISCVTFACNPELLVSVLGSIRDAQDFSRNQGKNLQIELLLIDNGPDTTSLAILEQLRERFQNEFHHLDIITGHGNIGYGRGNNLAILKSECTYHLVLNPDAILSPDVLYVAIQHFEADPLLGIAAPFANDEYQNPQYLAKRFPNPFTLALRFLNSEKMNQRFINTLNHYEYRDQNPQNRSFEIELASGCFMFCRTGALKEVGGFAEAFFMYFEDYDLSIRLQKTFKVKHFHDLLITHHGGNAGQKGWKHICYFLISAAKFYYKHWCWQSISGRAQRLKASPH